jgi:uncharacterized protein YndB with AHSA1/START domain
MADATKRELSFTRVFAAPRMLVFKMWIDPIHLARWWGPKGFSNPVCEVDARPGGAIYIDMQGPDGTIYPMSGQFHEIVEPERIVFTSAALGADKQPMFEVLNTITFTEHGGKTTILLHAKVKMEKPGADIYLSGMQEGWSQSLERLIAYLAKLSPRKDV